MFWDIIEKIVENKGKKLVKYSFFEKVWKKYFSEKTIILQAPTASGKTDVVLAPFIGQTLGYVEWHFPHLIYVLPTRSLVRRMYKRIKRTVSLFSNMFRGRIVVTMDYGGLLEDKPFLEGDIVITTYDTLLYTLYGFRSRGHHRILPLGIIASSIVILDEIQLLQDSYWYSLQLIPLHIANLVDLGAKVVLMGATIPKLLVDEIKSRVKNIEKVYCNEAKREPVKIYLENEELTRGLKKLFEQKDLAKPVLIVCNTVENAYNVFRYLRKKNIGIIELIHSRLKSKVRGVREEFEKVDVLVSTQVIEAGLDYPFKTVITEICPIDSLIQRIGRGGRKSKAVAYIFIDKNSAYKVYPREIIDATENIIKDTISDLELSVKSEEKALSLINHVYTKEMVEKLSKRVKPEIMFNVKAFLSTFLNRPFDRKDIYKGISQYILRLGVEVNTIVLSAEVYSKVLSRIDEEIWLPIKALDFITFSYDPIKKVYDIQPLRHNILGKEMYIVLKLERMEKGEGLFTVKSFNKLYEVLWFISKYGQGHTFTVLNPEYYEFINGYDVGVIRLR